jgi:hypothetical protein
MSTTDIHIQRQLSKEHQAGHASKNDNEKEILMHVDDAYARIYIYIYIYIHIHTYTYTYRIRILKIIKQAMQASMIMRKRY